MNELEKIFCNPRLTKNEYTKKYNDGYSNLYIIRKDVFWCRGINPKTKQKINSEAGAPFAAFILINILFNYIVYLSNMDYQNYIKEYFSIVINMKETEILNRLRNALVHKSYQLVWEPDIERKETGKITYFAMTEDLGSPLVEKIDEKKNDETWIVNIDKIHQAVENSITNLFVDLKNKKTLTKAIIERSENHRMYVISKNDFINYSRSKKEKLRK